MLLQSGATSINLALLLRVIIPTDIIELHSYLYQLLDFICSFQSILTVVGTKTDLVLDHKVSNNMESG